MIRIAGEENQLILCPYDKTHNIRLSRMQVHLVKCRRNHTSKEVAQCPFNVIHVVNKVELDVHIKICPQRKGFESFRFKDELVNETPQNSEMDLSVASLNLTKMSHMEESTVSWDDEPAAPSYDPAAYAQAARVFRQPIGLRPSERREFRAQERQRLQKHFD